MKVDIIRDIRACVAYAEVKGKDSRVGWKDKVFSVVGMQCIKVMVVHNETGRAKCQGMWSIPRNLAFILRLVGCVEGLVFVY